MPPCYVYNIDTDGFDRVFILSFDESEFDQLCVRSVQNSSAVALFTKQNSLDLFFKIYKKDILQQISRLMSNKSLKERLSGFSFARIG